MNTTTERHLVKAICTLQALNTTHAAENVLYQAIKLAREWLDTIDDPVDRDIRTREIGRVIVNAYATTADPKDQIALPKRRWQP